MLIVDGHEDIAWNVLTFGRDPTRSVSETRQLEAESEIPIHTGQALLGWPEWVNGRVAVVFATLFAAPIRRKVGPWETMSYRDSSEARRLYQSSLDVYRRLASDHADKFQGILSRRHLTEVLQSWEGDPPRAPRLGWVLLMEGAEAIEDPGEVAAWYEAGVRILGPAWTGTRFAGGTHEPGPLTKEGRTLLRAMDEVGMALDLSHMTDEGQNQALDTFGGVILSSHSNVRALLRGCPTPERHLSDEIIRRIAERQGVIGVMLYNPFLKAGWKPADGREAVPLGRLLEHIDYICQCTGSDRHVAIGSDFDGGLGLHKIPAGLDSVADLRSIGDGLAAAGYPQASVEAILGGNWLSLLAQVLPED
jgi:membrane dipeptidase